MLKRDLQPRAGTRVNRPALGSARLGYAATAFALTVFLSGCTTLGPEFVTPEADVQEDWADAQSPEFKPEAPPDDGRWWKVFGDPVLDRLIELAYSFEQATLARRAPPLFP